MMLAYHNDPSIKDAILDQLRAHALADELVKGQYWEDGKGCAVGCTIHSGNHAEYEPRFGIPQILAHLEDRIFEGLPNDKAKEWPARFMGAINPGAHLSRVGWKFLHWILTDRSVNPGIEHPLVKQEVSNCADLILKLSVGEPVSEMEEIISETSAWRAANRAGLSAASASRGEAETEAADEAGRAARSAMASAAAMASGAEMWRAAESAENAAQSEAWRAAESAMASAASTATVGAARSAASGADNEAWSEAWRAAESAAYVLMSNKLIELLEAAP